MHIYAFGSLCRGEIDPGSDLDMLALTNKFDPRFDPNVFSIYSYRRIQDLYQEGNPFAWHLSTEAKLIFASDGSDFLTELNQPTAYKNRTGDCEKFFHIYQRAVEALKRGQRSLVFELSTVFLAVRNFATCFSLGTGRIANFSRHSAKRLGDQSLKISDKAYQLLERSRILTTRGTGPMVQREELEACFVDICGIGFWMERLLTSIQTNE